jgi:hypothetical protein
MFIFDVMSGRMSSQSLLPVLDLITPRYPTRATEFLRIDFHQTNYGIHWLLQYAIFNVIDAP